MDTRIDEIADGIFRISTYTVEIPGGFTFNQLLVLGAEPFLFHCGPKEGSRRSPTRLLRALPPAR